MELLLLIVMMIIVISVIVRSASIPKNKVHEHKYSKSSQKIQNKVEIKNSPSGIYECKVERVIDGDTVIVVNRGEKIRVRLDSIDCPEDGQYWGDIATYGLIKLIGGKKIRLETHGVDCYDRTLATIYVQRKENLDWMNVNERMVTLGHAWVMRRFYTHLPRERQDKLNRLESWSRSKKVGLWKDDNPISPWQWRRTR